MSNCVVFALLAILALGAAGWKAPLVKKETALAKLEHEGHSSAASGCHPPTRNCIENMQTFSCHPPTRNCIQKASGCHTRVCMEKASGCRTRNCIENIQTFGCHPPTRNCIQKASGCHTRLCMEKASGCRTRNCLQQVSGCRTRVCLESIKTDACHPPTRNCGLEAAKQPMKRNSGQYGYSYTIPIGVGTPPQEFNVYLDMNHGDFWIPHTSCQIAPGSKCQMKNKFNSKLSSTYKQLDTLWYPTQLNNTTLNGLYGQDTVTFGSGSDALAIPSTTFELATQVGNGIIDPELADGVLGVAFTALSTYGNTTTVLENAANKHLLTPPVFTVWLDPNSNAGQISFGSLDQEHCPVGDLDYMPLWDPDYWAAYGDAVIFNGKSLDHTRVITVIFDINAPEILMSYGELDQIITELDATYSFEDSAYTVDCATKFTWGIESQASGWTLDQDQLLTKKSADDRCILPFGLNLDYQSEYVLGEAWMQNFCTVFDIGQQRVGMASLKKGGN